MHRRFALLAGLLTSWLICPIASRADSVIFSNLGTSNSYDVTIGYVGPDGASQSGTGIPADFAVPFTASSNVDLSRILVGVTWISQYGPSTTTIELVNDNSGLPGTTILETWTLATLPVTTSTGFPGIQASQTLTSIPNVFLAGGTQYWIVAQADGADSWQVNDTGQIGMFAIGHGATWSAAGGIHPSPAYEVTGTAPISTPEPSTLVFVGLTLCGISLFRKKAVT